MFVIRHIERDDLFYSRDAGWGNFNNADKFKYLGDATDVAEIYAVYGWVIIDVRI